MTTDLTKTVTVTVRPVIDQESIRALRQAAEIFNDAADRIAELFAEIEEADDDHTD